ncbi:Uridylate kinase [archaeon HR01]|nr:Uridylate kinase [archaeon HR01]
MNIVLKLGGHLIFSERTNTGLLRRYCEMLADVFDGGRWAVVVGGGSIARQYVNGARELGLDEASCDLLAIKITRVNAYLMASCLGDLAVQTIPTTLEELLAVMGLGKIVVTGGLQPGQSTIAVSAIVAAAIKAERIVVATDVDGVYTADPKVSADARLIPRLTFDELSRLVEHTSQRAGEYPLMDLVGLTLLRRARIPLYYVNGAYPERVRDALLGRGAGTVVEG